MRTGKKQGGFTYMGVLIAVVLIGLALGLAGESWRISVKREKEKELLFIGDQFRLAIKNYYFSSLGAVKQYPPSLDDLLKDARYPTTRRYLRRVYKDPLTGTAEWGLVKAPGNGIMGVYSLAEGTPLKQANFALADVEFESKASYQDWKFVMTPQSGVSQQGSQQTAPPQQSVQPLK